MSAPNAVQEHPVAQAIRAHLVELLARPLTLKTARDLNRQAQAAVKLLQTLEPGVGAHLDVAKKPRSPWLTGTPEGEEDEEAAPYAVPSFLTGTENMGASVLRELVPILSKIAEYRAQLNAPRPSPVQLLEGIKTARDLGLKDMEEQLKAQLLGSHSPAPVVAAPAAAEADEDVDVDGFVREGCLAYCRTCGMVKEGTITWAIEHANACSIRAFVTRDGRYYCVCGATHARGPVNGQHDYRCLQCGDTQTVGTNDDHQLMAGRGKESS